MYRILSYLALLTLLSNITTVNAQHFHADIHIHSSIKPYNSEYAHELSLWDNIHHSCEEGSSKIFVKGGAEIPKYSQANFENLVKGNVRLVYLSLTPIEYEMRHPRFVKNKDKLQSTMVCLTGMEVAQKFIEAESINYFEDLVENIQYVIDQQSIQHPIEGETYSFEVVKNKTHLDQILADDHKIAVMLSIEGGHAFGHSTKKIKDYKSEAYENLILENIDWLKGNSTLENDGKKLDYPIWFVTLNHFMYNGLMGHARTFNGKQKVFFNQNKKMNDGFSPLGQKVIDRLLDKESGRRILIDVKHMSIESRKSYYAYVHERRLKGDHIPIIASHVGISGISWDSKLFNKKDKNKKNKNSLLDNWTVNLANEDIQEIYQSGGLLGIMLDKYKINGNLGKKLLKKTEEGSIQRKELYIKIIAANILQVVHCIKDKKAWDIISIGSDFDGMISAIEFYDTSSSFPTLREDLIQFFSNPTDIFDVFSKTQIENYLYDYTAEEVVNKIMGKNATDFTYKITQ